MPGSIWHHHTHFMDMGELFSFCGWLRRAGRYLLQPLAPFSIPGG